MKHSVKTEQLLSLITCVLMVAAVSLRRDGKLLGHELTGNEKPEVAADSSASLRQDTISHLADGSMVVHTALLASDIKGYAGTVPLDITVRDGKVVGVKALKNTETPDFFSQADKLLTQWNGKTIAEAESLNVDVVTGATFSSRAIIGNMQRGLAFAAKKNAEDSISQGFDTSAKAIAGLVVALMAAVVPLFVKNRSYRICQQLLNVGVLGLWCGQFISYTLLISVMSNGMNIALMAVPIVMMATAFVYPLFGRKSHYCNHVCPFGSLQELAGRCVRYKIKMQPRTVKMLDAARKLLWAVLMLCLWTGIWFDWIDYEPFSTFVFSSASWVVIVLAVVFVLLSTVVARPYCRFVCPTGTLLKASQSLKSLRVGK